MYQKTEKKLILFKVEYYLVPYLLNFIKQLQIEYCYTFFFKLSFLISRNVNFSKYLKSIKIIKIRGQSRLGYIETSLNYSKQISKWIK